MDENNNNMNNNEYSNNEINAESNNLNEYQNNTNNYQNNGNPSEFSENIDQSQFFTNIDEEQQVPQEKEKSNLYWLIYVLVIIIVFIIIFLLLRGCNGLRNKNKSKILEANDWVTNMWNKCVDPVYWYTAEGTGVNGAVIDIDSVLSNCDTYYNEYKEAHFTVFV